MQTTPSSPRDGKKDRVRQHEYSSRASPSVALTSLYALLPPPPSLFPPFSPTISPSRPQIRICYNTAVNACAQSGEWETAVALVDEMRRAEENARPDAFTFNSVMFGMASVGEWELLLAVLDGMQDDGVAPDVVSYNTAMGACNKVRKFTLTRIRDACTCRHYKVALPNPLTVFAMYNSCLDHRACISLG